MCVEPTSHLPRYVASLPASASASVSLPASVSSASVDDLLAALAPPRIPADLTKPLPTLRDKLPRRTRRGRARIVQVLAQELCELHEEGICVGRIDPDVVRLGLTGYPQLVAMGAAQTSSRFTDSSTATHALSASSDVYALGALAFYVLTGDEPPRRWSYAALSRLSPEASNVIGMCVAHDPDDRPTAKAVHTQLMAVDLEALWGVKQTSSGRRSSAVLRAVLTLAAAGLTLAAAITTTTFVVVLASMMLGATVAFPRSRSSA